ncbi:MAG: hypothetical protein NC411_03470 [Bacteroides sp.]|nr:hypothetical protein [Bacteroides sp.]
MEIFKRHGQDAASCNRHKVLHCVLHATLQLATLAAALMTLNEVEKISKQVSRIKVR